LRIVTPRVIADVAVHYSLEVALELPAPCTAGEPAYARQLRGEHLVGIVFNGQSRRSRHRLPSAAEERAHADGRLPKPLGERERTHPDADDASRARMGRRLVRHCGAGEQEAVGRCAVVDLAANEVPDGRQPLPLIEEHRSLAVEQALGRGLGDRELGRVVEPADRAGVLQRRPGLAHPLRTLEGDRGQVREELCELVVNDPLLICPTLRHDQPATKTSG